MLQRALFGLALAWLAACSGREAPVPAPPPAEPTPRTTPTPQDFVTDCSGAEEALATNAADYAWQIFRALNEPLSGPGTRRWETEFRQTSSIFLPDGAEPSPWGTESGTEDWPDPAGCTATSDVWHNLDTAIQVDGLALLDLWNQDVRYQLLMNQPMFEEVVARQFYNTQGQELAAQQGVAATFPDHSFELKTSWIWIGEDASRCGPLQGNYYIAKAYYTAYDADGQPIGERRGYAALTGMHIINRCLPNWVWITFENVQNPKYTQITLELPLSSQVRQANNVHRGELAAVGSVFSHYQLDGVQTQFTEPASGGGTPTPTLLANSNIESAFQPQSSCITCHSLASIKPDGEYYNLVDTSGGNVSYYVGDPPDIEAQGFTSLDFAWSLKRAYRARNPQSASLEVVP